MMSRQIMIKQSFIVLMLLFLLLSCKEQVKEAPAGTMVKSFRVNGGWGYSIYLDNREFIRQAYIPVVEGLAHFNSKDKALRVGSLVLKKVLERQSPSLQREELIRLGIIDSSMAIIQE